MPELPDPTHETYYSAAVNEALDEELARDPAVVLLGEDIGVYGGAFGVTRGLFQKYGPERLWETPISENSVVGMAVGAATLGLRPVVEIMFMDFIALTLDQILNSAGKLHYMYNGQVTVPMVLRTPGGAKGGYGPSHSQMLTNLLVGIPGIKVVAPATPAAAKALLKSAIRDPNPVVFIENKRLYPRRGPVSGPDFVQPLECAEIAAPGSDLTLIAYSAMVPLALEVKKGFAAEGGADIEVVDLVSLQPLDTDTVFESVRRTGRVLIVEEACRTGGVGAEVAARIAAECLDVLEAPVLRVAAADTPIPSSMDLEKIVLPGIPDIVRGVHELMAW
ncbi:MAG: alpha-ketoacid dehydrogenase subunit beta [Kiritimatiellaeota bacterium]|nr:alpha-ketoacid dehydrogenase subunit beta [Kiritimatiellota bacterium]